MNYSLKILFYKKYFQSLLKLSLKFDNPLISTNFGTGQCLFELASWFKTFLFIFMYHKVYFLIAFKYIYHIFYEYFDPLLLFWSFFSLFFTPTIDCMYYLASSVLCHNRSHMPSCCIFLIVYSFMFEFGFIFLN